MMHNINFNHFTLQLYKQYQNHFIALMKQIIKQDHFTELLNLLSICFFSSLLKQIKAIIHVIKLISK